MNHFYKKIAFSAGFFLLLFLSVWSYRYYQRCTYLPVHYPFLSADAFRHIGDHCFDPSKKIKIIFTGQAFDPGQVKDGDIIYIKNRAYYLDKFFANMHPYIHAKYILLSQDGDAAAPGQYERYLDDEQLILWIGCNVENVNHPKMMPIPLGITGIFHKKLPRNSCEEIWGKLLIDRDNGKIKKDKLIYLNFKIATNPSERGKALDIFTKKGFCTKTSNLPYGAYLREMATCKFVVSPHGQGLDCYRTWEALMLGCIPIVKTSSLDGLYEGLPVLIVDDWQQVTEELLEQTYAEFSKNTYQLEKIEIDYWVRMIRSRVQALLDA